MVGTLEASLDKTYIPFEMEVAGEYGTFELPLSFFPIPTLRADKTINGKYRRNSIGNLEFEGVSPEKIIEESMYALSEGVVVVQPSYYTELGLTEDPEILTIFCSENISVFTSFHTDVKNLPYSYRDLLPPNPNICLLVALHEPGDDLICAQKSAVKRVIPDAVFCREVYPELIRKPIMGPKKSKKNKTIKKLLTRKLEYKGRSVLTFGGELIPLEQILSEFHKHEMDKNPG